MQTVVSLLLLDFFGCRYKMSSSNALGGSLYLKDTAVAGTHFSQGIYNLLVCFGFVQLEPF